MDIKVRLGTLVDRFRTCKAAFLDVAKREREIDKRLDGWMVENIEAAVQEELMQR